jgi:hypothetical protein
MDGVVAPLDKICDLADNIWYGRWMNVMLLVSSERQEKARLRLKE